MPDFTLVKISELPVAGGVADGDELIINQSGVTSRIRKDVLEASLTTASSGAGVTIQTSAVTTSEELTIAAGKLLIFVVAIGSAGNVKVGTTEDGGEIVDDAIVSSHIVYNTQYYFNSETQIWLTGSATFKLYFLA